MLYYSSTVKRHSEMIYNEAAHVKKKIGPAFPPALNFMGSDPLTIALRLS